MTAVFRYYDKDGDEMLNQKECMEFYVSSYLRGNFGPKAFVSPTDLILT